MHFSAGRTSRPVGRSPTLYGSVREARNGAARLRFRPRSPEPVAFSLRSARPTRHSNTERGVRSAVRTTGALGRRSWPALFGVAGVAAFSGVCARSRAFTPTSDRQRRFCFGRFQDPSCNTDQGVQRARESMGAQS